MWAWEQECKVSSMQNRLSFALFRLFKALLGKS